MTSKWTCDYTFQKAVPNVQDFSACELDVSKSVPFQRWQGPLPYTRCTEVYPGVYMCVEAWNWECLPHSPTFFFKITFFTKPRALYFCYIGWSVITRKVSVLPKARSIRECCHTWHFNWGLRICLQILNTFPLNCSSPEPYPLAPFFFSSSLANHICLV